MIACCMAVLAAVLAGAPSGQLNSTPPVRTTAASAIRAVLDEQAAAWNRGDIDAFMKGYWNSSELTFYSGGNVTSGWDATLQRYRTRYQGEGHEMGKLDFSELDIHLLARDAAWVGGRWQLKMSDGKDLGGLFSLIFRKLPEGWRIVHDHTSASESH